MYLEARRDAIPVEEALLARLRAALIFRELHTEQMEDYFRSGDADLILNTLSDLRQGARRLLRDIPNAPRGLVSELASEVPTMPVLLAREDVFPIAMRTTNRGRRVPVGRNAVSVYGFEPIPRRIHGLWKGVPLGECVGGSCDSLAHTTPERWATVALAHAELYHVEVSGGYRGFVQVVPITRAGG